MKKTFRGIECNDLDVFFESDMTEEKAIFGAAKNRDTPFKLVVGEGYRCCEYQKKINIFSFGQARLTLSFTVIAPPASIDRVGYFGDLDSLISDYSKQRGLFLVLNERQKRNGLAACAHTLSTAILTNKFSSYEEYKNNLRSHYRRRLTLAEKKGAKLQWKRVPSQSFDQELYQLYLQVLHHSDFPLETLGINFFRSCPAEVYGLYDSKQKPVAFIMISNTQAKTTFIFGGMDYSLRDTYDLYYNMMIQVLQVGFAHHADRIDFGQTAENTKCRLGCVLEPRYMLFFTGNPLLMILVKRLIRFIEYKPIDETYHVFKESE
jgi:hypothetical protein